MAQPQGQVVDQMMSKVVKNFIIFIFNQLLLLFIIIIILLVIFDSKKKDLCPHDCEAIIHRN